MKFTITFYDDTEVVVQAADMVSACILASAHRIENRQAPLIIKIEWPGGCKEDARYLWLTKVPLPLKVRLMDTIIVWLFGLLLIAVTWALLY